MKQKVLFNLFHRCSRYLAFFSVFVVLAISITSLSENAARAAKLGGNFSLTDHNGNVFSLNQLRGKITLLVFGYTSCPDVCPMELTTISSALKKLQRDDVSAVLISVDPARDTASRLKEYVSFFHPNIVGLTGTLADITLVADQYGVRFQHHGEANGYSVDHSSDIFIINREGQIEFIASFGVSDAHLISTVNFLADENR